MSEPTVKYYLNKGASEVKFTTAFRGEYFVVIEIEEVAIACNVS